VVVVDSRGRGARCWHIRRRKEEWRWVDTDITGRCVSHFDALTYDRDLLRGSGQWGELDKSGWRRRRDPHITTRCSVAHTHIYITYHVDMCLDKKKPRKPATGKKFFQKGLRPIDLDLGLVAIDRACGLWPVASLQLEPNAKQHARLCGCAGKAYTLHLVRLSSVISHHLGTGHTHTHTWALCSRYRRGIYLEGGYAACCDRGGVACAGERAAWSAGRGQWAV
jgi:hypothetical protein